MSTAVLSEREFGCFQRFIFDAAGIHMSTAKKTLVAGRLMKRLKARGLESFGAYFDLLTSGEAGDEVQTAIDLLTTNETYFFREPRHFEVLREMAEAAAARHQPLKVWSAASSSGEEVYSIAMLLADVMPELGWEVLGTDISTRVLERARRGHYPLERARHVPAGYLRRFCLKGHGEQEGTLLVQRSLRERVRFAQVNLNDALPALGPFDAVFLRNVMIYFQPETKRQVVLRVAGALKPGGHLFIGHSESLNDLRTGLEPVMPALYRKPLHG